MRKRLDAVNQKNWVQGPTNKRQTDGLGIDAKQLYFLILSFFIIIWEFYECVVKNSKIIWVTADRVEIVRYPLLWEPYNSKHVGIKFVFMSEQVLR